MMQNFKISYDKENDDLFVYLEGKKSKGAVEIGNFILDFDENQNLVAIQILEASIVLSKIAAKLMEVSKIKEFQADIINFRNMTTIQFKIITDSGQDTANLIIPRIKEQSPALSY